MPRPARGLLARLRTGVRAFLLSDEPPEWFWRTPGVRQPTISGATVTDQTALRVTGVLSCVKALADPISTLPPQSRPIAAATSASVKRCRMSERRTWCSTT